MVMSSGVGYMLDIFRLHAVEECLRVVASAYAHEQCSCAALSFREVPQARHSPAKSSHSVGSISPQEMEIRLVRIAAKVEAAVAAVETFLKRRGAVWDREECGRAPSV